MSKKPRKPPMRKMTIEEEIAALRAEEAKTERIFAALRPSFWNEDGTLREYPK